MFTRYEMPTLRGTHRVLIGWNAQLMTAWFEVHDVWREKGNEALERRLQELSSDSPLYQRLMRHLKESLVAFGGLFENDIPDGAALAWRVKRWVQLTADQVARIDRDRRRAFITLASSREPDSAASNVQQHPGLHPLPGGSQRAPAPA